MSVLLIIVHFCHKYVMYQTEVFCKMSEQIGSFT